MPPCFFPVAARVNVPTAQGRIKRAITATPKLETLEIQANKNHLLRKAPYIQELTIPVLI